MYVLKHFSEELWSHTFCPPVHCGSSKIHSLCEEMHSAKQKQWMRSVQCVDTYTAKTWREVFEQNIWTKMELQLQTTHFRLAEKRNKNSQSSTTSREPMEDCKDDLTELEPAQSESSSSKYSSALLCVRVKSGTRETNGWVLKLLQVHHNIESFPYFYLAS